MQKDTQTNMGLEYKKIWIKLLFSATVTLLLSSTSYAQQQKFRVTPHDLQVLEGSEALLRCEVTNQAGQVQWTKDGFALGFSAVIPGFPRYSVLGDRKQGVYNLRISNASIMDDADFQCQVGPARLNSAIRANAKLTVISPPSSIEIDGHAHNSKVEVKENKELTLKCTVANAKPASQIIWYRGNNEYKPDKREDKIEEISPKRFTTTSQIKLKPMSEDDYTEYSCQAKHKALPPDMPMRSTVQLSVLYPPGAPYIEGYTQGETIRRGQTVELICRSRGGNPPAQLIWYKNGSQVRMAYRTSGRLSENIYTFTAQASDNKARFRCEANNIMSQNALKTEIELAVIFAPTHVSVTGPSEARVGDIVPLTCSTAPSNPPAEVKWMVGGRQIRNATSNTSVSPDGGWITTSNITALVEPNKRSLIVICNGLNLQMAENVVSTHTVNVLYPPTPPLISGYVEGKMIPAGSVVNLLCISSGGNPLATLTWYKNDKRVNSIIRTSDKSVTAEINILANVTDNQAQYRCEAQNSATEIPLFESTTLNVHFAPETAKIRVEPDELKPGNEATLVCDSSSSNPPAKLSWWKDGISIDENRTLFESVFKGIKNYSKPGLWGGTVSTLELRINVTQEMNGVVYTCQSSNEALQRSVHEAIALDVLYAPKFIPPPSSTVVGVESESLQVLLMATANPMSITYVWTKDGLAIPLKTGESKDQRIFSDGPTLNITKLHRNDAGIYKCEASNSQGTTLIHITVIVEYGTTIKSISENVVVNPGEDALLSCSVEGKPLIEEHIKWERMGYNMSIKTSTSFNNGTSSLLIKRAQREDVGNFRCVADNRVANPTNRDVLLIVKFAPEIEKSPILLRSASGTGERGRLSCRAQAAPRPSFTWLQLGKDLHINRTYKYDVEVKKIDFITYESTLIIEKVAPADYGSYECVVKNDLGETREKLRLEITSQPEPPLSLNVLNITHDSVTIGWTPGFNGGLKASYRVRYREATTDQYKYTDALPNSHKLTISGLKMDTLYLFSITAINELGNSKYLPDLQRAHTKEHPPPSQPASSLGGPPTTSSTPMGGTSGLLLFVGAAFGVIIVLLNVFIIGCCLHKRNQTRMKRRGFEFVPAEFTATSNTPDLVIIGISLAAFGFLLINAALVAWFFVHQKRKRETANQTNKTATIEMYAPSSYNDTVTGETLSSVSEKSDSYSNEGSQPEYMEDARKKGTSTYLAENSDMPPPRYQKDGTLPSLYSSNLTNARTLPHPRNNTTNIDHRPRDDQMLLSKGVYIPSPSPAPPPDGSYYNMNSERYLSYPPMDYPQVDFSPTQLPITHIQSHPSGTFSGGSTLRRGIMRGIVGGPPPDVTHHTSNSNLGHQQLPLEHIHLGNTISSSTQTSTSNASAQINNISHGSQQHNTIMSKLPQSILKDSKRNLQASHILSNSSGQIMGIGVSSINSQSTSGTLGSIQLQNIQNSSGISNNLLVSGYESTPHNLSTFNTTTMAYTDADGHLV